MYKDVVKLQIIVKPLGRDLIRHTYIINSLGIDIMRHNKIHKNKHVIGRIHMSASAANRTGPRNTRQRPTRHPPAGTESTRPGSAPTDRDLRQVWLQQSSKPVRSHRAQPKATRAHGEVPRAYAGHHKKPAPTDWRKAAIGKIHVIHIR